jgi:hypothetical protein
LQYNLKTPVDPPNSGTVDGAGTYEAGTQRTVIATAGMGYRFGSWSNDLSGTSNPSNVFMDSDKIATAHFVKTWNLSVSANPTAYAIAPNGGIYDAGTSVKLTATTLFPYTFKSWTGTDNNNINPATVKMSGDTNISLNFVQCFKDINTQTASGTLALNMGAVPTATATIQLNNGEWVQGQVIADTSPLVYFNIKDPNGNMIKDFGAPGQASFTFQAQVTGPYTITFQNNTIYYGHYSLSYNIYHLP